MCVPSIAALKAGLFLIIPLPRNSLANFTVVEHKMKYAFFVCVYVKVFSDCQKVMELWSTKILAIKVAVRADHEISDGTS